MSEAVTDRRRPPFCYQTHDALDALAGEFSGQRLATARSVYVALTEAANRAGGAGARDGFQASRADVAARAGVSVDTLDRYAVVLVRLGLLAVERRTEGRVNLPNVWALAEPDPPTAPPAPPGRTRAATPGRTGAAIRAGEDEDLRNKEEGETVVSLPPLAHVDGRNLALDALAEETGLPEGDPAYRQAAVALNGRDAKRGGGVPEAGIAAVAWQEVVDWCARNGSPERLEELRENPGEWTQLLARMIHWKAAKYRREMGDAILTPKALRDWWLRLDRMDAIRGSRRGTHAGDLERVL